MSEAEEEGSRMCLSPHPYMEMQSNENLHPSPIPDAHYFRDTEEKNGDFSREQAIRILQDIASSGRFWHDWDKLKSILSFQLKQVWGEYPEAKITSELLNRLDQALSYFVEGPPFTLQRLCEILLDAKSIYPNLSKLALALEKNLLVTSTLTIISDPCPQTTVQEPDDQEKISEKQQQSNSPENGIAPLVADKDEVTAEADIGDDMIIEMVSKM